MSPYFDSLIAHRMVDERHRQAERYAATRRARAQAKDVATSGRPVGHSKPGGSSRPRARRDRLAGPGMEPRRTVVPFRARRWRRRG